MIYLLLFFFLDFFFLVLDLDLSSFLFLVVLVGNRRTHSFRAVFGKALDTFAGIKGPLEPSFF